jgi:hypothetical protein
MRVRGVARGGPIMCLAYVLVMMFLPMFQLDCGFITLDWTGVQLVTGSSAPLEGVGRSMNDMMGSAFEGFGEGPGGFGEVSGELADVVDEGAAEVAGEAEAALPSDWAVLALPVLALLGIFALLARQGAASALLIALLIAAFAYFAVQGFELERMFAAQLAAGAEGGPSPSEMMGPMGGSIGVKKAMPFWLGFGASGLALVLLLTGGGGAKSRARRG